MDRPTLMMIHGLVGSLEYFDPQARLPGIRVVSEDMLGYGQRADVPPERLTLAAQADHVATRIDALSEGPVWLLGHSMGGAVALLVAERRPDRVVGLINVEGNLTAKDTFWSQRIAEQKPHEWAERYAGMRADPAAWLARCGVEVTPQRTVWAEHLLSNQPASTVQAMSRALIDETLAPAFLGTVRRVLDGGLTMHLLAGEKSAAGWGVPDFVRRAAASYTRQGDAGHLMMLEEPGEFCRIVKSLLSDAGAAPR